VGRFRRVLLWAFMLGAGGPAVAQSLAPPSPPPIVAAAAVQSPEAARAQDAAAVAERLGVTVEEAIRHLRLQEASVPVTDAIADRFADRLTGIAVEHRPDFEIVVTLTGDAPVPEQIVDLDGSAVRVTFRTGAAVDHTGLVQAITAYQATIRASLIAPPGLGIDQRSGELVAVVSGRDVAREGAGPLAEWLAALTHVPVRLRVVDQPALDMGGIQGGARVVGQVPGDTHRYLCTAGFVVTDGLRTGLATAAHCPDELTGRDADGHEQALPFVGQWGWGHQDVQINASASPLAPLFFADTAKTISRPVVGARGRAGMRAGDVVCHRGERTGYSCSQVELTDFAPAGDLCGGACLPTWTTVAGPVCKSGDSGSPVFLGDTAYGILKGGSYRPDGSCAFYFYMSTDYLPSGWRLLTADPAGRETAPPLSGLGGRAG
jgi:streptogrisin C